MKKDYRTLIENTRHSFNRGEITHDQAKAICKPLINEMNEKAKVIAKQFGKRFTPFTFGYLFR